MAKAIKILISILSLMGILASFIGVLANWILGLEHLALWMFAGFGWVCFGVTFSELLRLERVWTSKSETPKEVKE